MCVLLNGTQAPSQMCVFLRAAGHLFPESRLGPAALLCAYQSWLLCAPLRPPRTVCIVSCGLLNHRVASKLCGTADSSPEGCGTKKPGKKGSAEPHWQTSVWGRGSTRAGELCPRVVPPTPLPDCTDLGQAGIFRPLCAETRHSLTATLMPLLC